MKNIFTNNLQKITIGTLLVVVGLMVGIFLSSPRHTQAPSIIEDQERQEGSVPEEMAAVSNTKEPICVGEFCDGSGESDDTSHLTVLNIPLINTSSEGGIGCGTSVFFAPHAIKKTSGVMKATYEKLFSLAEQSDVPSDMIMNYVASETQLIFNEVSLNKGTARVYLSGQIRASHCAIPAFRAQMEQAALQFDTVQKVEFYLNNEMYNWCEKDESDGEGPCPEIPQDWIAYK
jgi:hypothetical protein